MLPDRHEYFMKAALAEAGKALEKQEVPVGAVIVHGDMIIARAHNLTETLRDPTAHAEMQAITAATDYMGGKYLTDCTIYVTLEPCGMCAGAIGWSQASSLVYGADDEKRDTIPFQENCFIQKPGSPPVCWKKNAGNCFSVFLKAGERVRISDVGFEFSDVGFEISDLGFRI
jgi:tRNA(adenine34) deaminase